jgi:beta-glucosidase/6-phospho-beta-glucosidase/beta-galactosidase
MFDSFFMAGFECSSHRRPDGVRLDLIRSTGHHGCVLEDYRACSRLGLTTVRDGLRWHLIEQSPGRYDWSSWQPMLEASAEAGVQIIWDLCHYGYPDDLQLDSEAFVERFAAFAAAAVREQRRVTGRPALICPINEISFFAWAVNSGYFPSLPEARPGLVKRQLIRAALAGIAAIRAVEPETRFVWAEPLINIVPRGRSDEDIARARMLHDAQFEALDLLLGRGDPELGGGPHAADCIGLNYYPENQWIEGGSVIPMGNYDYVPLAELLAQAHHRFGKPLFIAETGAERSARPAWFRYVCDEVAEARRNGIPIEGVCIYPVTSFPGWDDSRHADVGLFSTPRADGTRRVYEPLASELRWQQEQRAGGASPQLLRSCSA